MSWQLPSKEILSMTGPTTWKGFREVLIHQSLLWSQLLSQQKYKWEKNKSRILTMLQLQNQANFHIFFFQINRLFWSGHSSFLSQHVTYWGILGHISYWWHWDILVVKQDAVWSYSIASPTWWLHSYVNRDSKYL